MHSFTKDNLHNVKCLQRMTDKYLKSLIDKLNKNLVGKLIQIRPLSATVDFGKVWTEMPKPTSMISNLDGPYNFYFIKNTENIYVATILDMRHDLHWFVDKNHRGKGYLTKAMEKTILFHLFQDRKEQRITIDKNKIGEENYKSSENVALSVGFINTNDKEYILSSNRYQTENYIEGENTSISENRKEELKKQINYLANSLWLIQSELEMKLGDSEYTKELREMVTEIKRHIWQLEDVWYDSEEIFKKNA